MKKFVTTFLAVLMSVPFCVGNPPDGGNKSVPATLNGVDISEYVIVYGNGALDYSSRAANYIRDKIREITGISLAVTTDAGEPSAHEIVVGETNRKISSALDAATKGVEFALMSADGHVAMEADFFVIAAAAYYFVENHVEARTDVPAKATVCRPIVEKAKNHILLIGDGMGLYQTLLFDVMDSSTVDYSDGENIFYGYLLPNMGFARTDSLSGTTDSAAAGTALATGYKTKNGYVGVNGAVTPVRSLTEIASSLGKATAVMSTEVRTGATPSAFSAHAKSRNDSATILASQAELTKKYDTIIKCDFNLYTASGVKKIEKNITDTLASLSKNENGFFLMYEEAHIDKHSHNNDMSGTFNALLRFNQAVAVFMEYAFYNPDTFVLITADHETGKLLPAGGGKYSYGSNSHTSMYVPVFAYGNGSKIFEGKVIENIQIPKTIASFWNHKISGTDDDKYPALSAPVSPETAPVTKQH